VPAQPAQLRQWALRDSVRVLWTRVQDVPGRLPLGQRREHVHGASSSAGAGLRELATSELRRRALRKQVPVLRRPAQRVRRRLRVGPRQGPVHGGEPDEAADEAADHPHHYHHPPSVFPRVPQLWRVLRRFVRQLRCQRQDVPGSVRMERQG